VVAAAFDHGQSRTGDPHLHTHVVTANLVQAEDGRWGSLDGRGLFAHAVAADRLYQAHLRHEVSVRTGLTWSRRPSGHYELDAVAPEVRGVLSGRQADIRAELAGRRGRGANRVAWAVTRPDKAQAADPERGRAVWRARAVEVGWPGAFDRAAGPAIGPAALDERVFAADLVGDRRAALYRRDAVAAWCHGLAPGAPAGAVRQAVDRWLGGPGDGPGVSEARRNVADLVPAPHLIAVLGPRPGTEPGLTAWRDGARAVTDYRQRFEVTDPADALGLAAGGLSALPAGRLAAHLAVCRQVDEVRRDLGRSPWRQPPRVDLGRDRS
jgi:hypothetical protein